jgi:hypothetical protein
MTEQQDRQAQLKELEAQMQSAELWEDPQRAQEVIAEYNQLKQDVTTGSTLTRQERHAA